MLTWAGMAHGTETLATLIASKRYSEATGFSKQQTPAQVIAQVRPLSLKNDAPAQWMLADAYWRANQREEAIQWAYTALVSTRLDVSSCRNKENVVPWMMQNYQAIFREARRHPEIQARALRFSMSHHASQITLPKDQAWACRLAAHLNGRKQETGNITASKDLIWRKRDLTLKSLAKEAGIAVEISARPSLSE
jgi:hypothetical protein